MKTRELSLGGGLGGVLGKQAVLKLRKEGEATANALGQ